MTARPGTADLQVGRGNGGGGCRSPLAGRWLPVAARWSLPVLALLLLAAGLPALDSEGRGHMNDVLCRIGPVTVTGWKILGFLGAFCFGGRWLVQWWHRKRTGSSQMPTLFWVISLGGALMVTMYFIWGKNDSVGILTNALPASVALYNLIQDLKAKRAARAA